MTYLLLGAAAVVLLLFGGRGRKPFAKRREWRFLTAMFALAAFAGAAWLGVRQSWGGAVVLTVVGLWLLTATRQAAAPRAAAPPPSQARMSAAEARSILGVGEGAGPDEIKAAYARLMRLAHPDKGGTAGLAAQLNAARERLLKG
ncbi:J domain-containing protein [Phenylobacterium sp.]|jgi:hypothetical protein|uniref:J domain-containing protein n=1 Tax=Phenylobacterium sp. TaxID=1871053 RepID=UPI0037834175